VQMICRATRGALFNGNSGHANHLWFQHLLKFRR